MDDYLHAAKVGRHSAVELAQSYLKGYAQSYLKGYGLIKGVVQPLSN